MIDDSTQYIARISYGKDSLKMLDVIKSRGLPLDRITTTDVWATDTIPANLPPMMAFKERMDQKIWDMYRIEVEHLCALNKDGSKKTYEQMFYHIPKRKLPSAELEKQKRLQSVQVERERERERDGLRPGTILGFPDLWNPWCQAGLKRNAYAQSPGKHYRIPTQHPVQLVSKTQTCARCHSRIPLSRETMVQRRSQDSCSDTKDSQHRSLPGAENSRSTTSKPLFR